MLGIRRQACPRYATDLCCQLDSGKISIGIVPWVSAASTGLKLNSTIDHIDGQCTDSVVNVRDLKIVCLMNYFCYIKCLLKEE